MTIVVEKKWPTQPAGMRSFGRDADIVALSQLSVHFSIPKLSSSYCNIFPWYRYDYIAIVAAMKWKKKNGQLRVDAIRIWISRNKLLVLTQTHKESTNMHIIAHTNTTYTYTQAHNRLRRVHTPGWSTETKTYFIPFLFHQTRSLIRGIQIYFIIFFFFANISFRLVYVFSVRKSMKIRRNIIILRSNSVIVAF